MKNVKLFLIKLLLFILILFLWPINAFTAGLSSSGHEWDYYPNSKHIMPNIPNSAKTYISKYNGYYVFNTSQKVIYLTFDAGYENGYTAKILDILKKHNIKSAFFATKGFIAESPKLIKRMVEEGHIVANHTVHHIDLYKLSESQIANELKGVEEAYKGITGKTMLKYVRPPEGAYSEKSLYITNKLGYKSIFWSIYLPNDWNLTNQPSSAKALALFEKQSHSGAIVLLHAVSPVIAKNLDAMLTVLEKQGYSFGSITDI